MTDALQIPRASADASADMIRPILADLDDDILMAMTATGDQAAYRVLVERHADRAFGLALRLLRNRADAEDVAQDALLKIWLNRAKWRPGTARLSTWLYRVVVNACIDLRRRPVQETLDDCEEPADDSDDALARLHKAEVVLRLEQAVGRLPEHQRTALILSYYEDIGNAEIAQVMDTTVQAVESLLKRARTKLREVLRRSEQDMSLSR